MSIETTGHFLVYCDLLINPLLESNVYIAVLTATITYIDSLLDLIFNAPPPAPPHHPLLCYAFCVFFFACALVGEINLSSRWFFIVLYVVLLLSLLL